MLRTLFSRLAKCPSIIGFHCQYQLGCNSVIPVRYRTSVGVKYLQPSHNRHGRGPRRKRTNRPSRNWRTRKIFPEIDQEGPLWTSENRSFLEKAVDERLSPAARLESSPLKEAPWPRGEFTLYPLTFRTGLLGIKLGTYPLYDKAGNRVFTTLIQIVDNHVVDYIPPEEACKSIHYKDWWYQRISRKPNYGISVVGALSCDPRRFHPRYTQLFEEAGCPPKRKLTRFLVTPNAAIRPGTPLQASHFRVGDYVDISAKSIAWGFQGVVMRYGIGGDGKKNSRNSTKSHRRIGAIGHGRQHKVIKGKRMPGRMGEAWRVTKGLRILRINTKYNVLYLNGSGIPGPVHSYCRIYDTVLPNKRLERFLDNPPFMPTFYPDEHGPLAEDIYTEDVFHYDDSSIEFAVESEDE